MTQRFLSKAERERLSEFPPEISGSVQVLTDALKKVKVPAKKLDRNREYCNENILLPQLWQPTRSQKWQRLQR